MTNQIDPQLAAETANRIANLFQAAITGPTNHGPASPKPPVMPSDPGLPTDLLPGPVETWLHDTAIHTNVPPAMIVMPYLAGTGGVIGNRLGLHLQSTWIEYPAIWIALVTLTGGGKTPALLAARQPFNALHRELLAANRASGDPDIPLIITRGTWHQLQQLLPCVNGLLLHRDELRGLIQAIDRGAGETRQHYLSLWSGDVLDDTTHDIIDHPVVSIVGGIQPLLLFTLRRKQHDGLLERFLPVLAGSPNLPWDRPLPPVPALDNALTPLRTLRAITGSNLVTLAPDARHLWANWYDAHGKLLVGAVPVLHGFYRKYPLHLARLILVIHALWHPDDPATPVSRDTVDRAITLIEYLRIQLHRSLVFVNQKYPLRSPTESLVSRIERHLAANKQNSGWIKRSALHRQLGNAPTALFSTALEQLLASGRIEQRLVKPERGRPAEEFRLTSHSSFARSQGLSEEIGPRKPMESAESDLSQISFIANEILSAALKQVAMEDPSTTDGPDAMASLPPEDGLHESKS